MNETLLTLKSGVTLTEREGKIGLTLHGHIQYAKNERQGEILRALVKQRQSLNSIKALLCAKNGKQSDNENSLAIAEFILDFGEFLEA